MEIGFLGLFFVPVRCRDGDIQMEVGLLKVEREVLCKLKFWVEDVNT